MKKILPINNNPYIKTYTHHAYHHAVISSNDKVLLNSSDEVASIQVKDFEQYTWLKECEQLGYQIADNNYINFYGNKWNVDMNAAFWRTCNGLDEMEICIYKQLYTNIWASVLIFITNDKMSKMTDKDSSYEFQVGNFSKDGVYYRFGVSNHQVIFPTPSLPVKIYLIKKDDKMIIGCSDLNEAHEIIISDIDNISFNKIGFAINLGCNNYYEWLFSNYINFYVDQFSLIPIDFFCNTHKNWTLHTNDYFIDYNLETEQDIKWMGFSSIQYIKKMLDLNRYIETDINDNIHLKKSDETGTLFHQNLIYGYDDSYKCLYVLYYNKGKISATTITYDEFLSKQNYIYNRKLYIFKYNPGYEGYKLSERHLLQLLIEYKTSQNITFYENQYENNMSIGIKSLKSFLSPRGFEIFLTDIRISYLLYEHSICNRDRIEYIWFKGIIDKDFYKNIYSLAQEECYLTLKINNLIIKKICGGKVDLLFIKKCIKEIIILENEITDKLISKLKECIKE